jgi:hypothetical protein
MGNGRCVLLFFINTACNGVPTGAIDDSGPFSLRAPFTPVAFGNAISLLKGPYGQWHEAAKHH